MGIEWRRLGCFLFHFWRHYSVVHVDLKTEAVQYYCFKCRRTRWINA